MTAAPPPPVSDLDRAIAAHRAALLRQDAATLAIVDRRWRVVQARLQRDIDALLAQLDDRMTPGRLRRLQRYRDLLAQVEQQVQTYADSLAPTITAGQQSAVTMAAEHARSLVAAQLGENATWNTLPRAATSELIGTLADGSPLVEYLAQFGPAAAAAAEDALVAGVARGKGVKVIAAELAKVFGASGAVDPGAIGRKAMLTARQSVMGSYRSASLESYKANSDIIEGWVWHSALNRRTCPVCWAMHGSIHKVTETFSSHIACRCSPLPRTKSWESLGLAGIPETRPTIEDGADVFARLSEAEQRAILGPTKLRMWNAGLITFEDLVARTHSAKWGDGLRERSVMELTQ
jgi:SPP1 gp7 family putative phage head morphogenesis protein